MSDPGVVFARRGERVTDEKGRTVAIVKRDLYRHTLATVDDFEWKIAVPKKGAAMQPPGFRELPDGRPQVCIDGEWRPELSQEGG